MRWPQKTSAPAWGLAEQLADPNLHWTVAVHDEFSAHTTDCAQIKTTTIKNFIASPFWMLTVLR